MLQKAFEAPGRIRELNQRNCDRHDENSGRRSIQAVRMHAVVIMVVRSREQIGRSRERGAKAGLRLRVAL